MKRIVRWRTACTAFGWGVLLSLGFAEEAAPATVLPQLDVTTSAEKRESWKYADVGGWEVFSQVSDGRARSLLQSLKKFDFALHLIQPRLVTGKASALTIVFVDEPRYRRLVGLAAATQSPEFSTLVHRAGRSAILVNAGAEFDVDSTGLVTTVDDSDTGVSASGHNAVDTYRQLDRQYVRHILAAQHARLPAWLEEGLAQSLTDLEYRGTWVVYGKIETEKNMPVGDQPVPGAIPDFLAANSAISGLSFKQVFAHRRFMPLEAFFTATQADGSAPSPDSAWAKQAYALVHFCNFGNKLRYQQPLAKLATRLASEPMSEKLFKECFGIGYAKMENELSGYMDYTRHTFQRYPLNPDQRLTLDAINFREAEKAELDRLKRLEP